MPSRHHRQKPPPPSPTRAPEGTDERQFEQDKYRWLYKEFPNYKMGKGRLEAVSAWLDPQDPYNTDSMLDIGCGRGELLTRYQVMKVRGYEVVQELCSVGAAVPEVLHFEGMHEIPEEDNSWDLVVCSDVLEHVLEADALAGIAEMIRVARKKVYLSVSTTTDSWGKSLGPNEVLHITIHPIEWWMLQIDKITQGPRIFIIAHDQDWFQLEIDVESLATKSES